MKKGIAIMTATIRQCTSDVAGLICSLGMTTFRDTFAADNSQENMEDYLLHSFSSELIKSQLSESESVLLLASVDCTPAAYMQLSTGKAQTEQFGDTSIEIERLYVLSDFKRHGLGTLLVNQAFERARNQRLSKIWLGVWEHNEPAQRFYQAMGFKRTGEHTFTLGADIQTDWIMTAAIN